MKRGPLHPPPARAPTTQITHHSPLPSHALTPPCPRAYHQITFQPIPRPCPIPSQVAKEDATLVMEAIKKALEEAGFPQRSNEIDYSAWAERNKPIIKGRRHLKNNYEDEETRRIEEDTSGIGGSAGSS